MKKTIFLIALLLTGSGCVVQKIPFATGGSRSDGVITMSYTYGAFSTVEIDWGAVQSDAANKCAGWGYASAQPFGGQQTTCLDRDCYSMQVDIDYQCMGLLD